jgi:hypothetical protein
MLLNVEWPRIKRDTKDGNVRQITSPSFANGKTQHHGDHLSSKNSFQQRAPSKRIRNPRTGVTLTEGYLKKKNWFTPGMMMAQMRPSTQARKVDAGIEGSSVLETAERTSGYGDSSSSAKAVGSKFGSSNSSIAMLPSCVFSDRTCQAHLLCNQRGEEIIIKFTDQVAAKMIRTLFIKPDGLLFFIG